MPYLTGNTPTPNVFICRRLRIPDDQGFLLAVNGAISTLLKSYNWEQFGTLTPEDAAQLGIDLWLDYIHSEGCMIGTITAYATITPPAYCLACDGSLYDRADYPTLYDKLEAAYIVDADHFRTPDLQGQVILGASITYPFASTGGAADHTMTELELVPHIHTTIPHAHSEIGAVSSLINGGLEAPASAAQPFPTSTGLADVTVNSAGGGQPFSTLPPYTALRYCIVAK